MPLSFVDPPVVDYVRECWKCGEPFDASDAAVMVCPFCGCTRIVPYGERFSDE